MPKDRSPDRTRQLDDSGASQPVYQRIGRALQVLRAELGLSRKQLATRAGLSYSYLSEIEGGKKEPSSKTMFVLADALGVSPSELMAAAETRVRSSATAPRSRRYAPDYPDAAPTMAREMPAAPEPSASIELGEEAEDPRQTSWFRSRRRARQQPGAGTDLRLDREELIAILERLDPEDRQLVMEFARRLVR